MSFNSHYLYYSRLHKTNRLTTYITSLESKINICETLLAVLKKLHSTNEVESLLEIVFDHLGVTYPDAHFEMYLTQGEHTSKRVKQLPLTHIEGDICVQAFMEGRAILRGTEQSSGQLNCTLAVPLCGKQGVYGVLLLESEQQSFSDNRSFCFSCSCIP
jgi:hypothetical protein